MVGAVGPTGVPQQEPAVAAEGAEMRFYVLRLLQKPFSAGVVLSAEASEPHTVIFGFSAHSSRRHAYFASGGRFCSVPTTHSRVKGSGSC